MNLNVFRFLTGHHETTQAQIAALQREIAAEHKLAAARHLETKELLMTISAQGQALIDQVTATKSIEQASALALQGLVTGAADLKNQKAALQAKDDAVTSSAEDLAAMTQAVSDLHDSAVALQTATPAGIPAAQAAAATVAAQ